jgi:DNA-3-methyladenine glycosylase I
VAAFDADDVERLMADSGIIRNRAKLVAMINNAHAFLALQAKHGSVDAFFWRYVDGTPLQPRYQIHAQIPTVTPLSTQMANDLKRAGFRFIGPTMCYALMEATGMINDHVVDCHRHAHLAL